MQEHTPTRTEPETGVSPSQIVEEIVANLQATHKEPIVGEGDMQEAFQTAHLVSF